MQESKVVDPEPRKEIGKGTVMIHKRVLAAFDALQSAHKMQVRTLSDGLLHQTYRVDADGRPLILQRVSDVFAPEIHANIDAVSRHLSARGLDTFELLPTRNGTLFADLADLGRWRLMTVIEGATFHHITTIEQAKSAGALVGRFHAALDDFDAPLAPLGIPYRNTPLYLERLKHALAEGHDHPLIADARTLAESILREFERLGPPPKVPVRVIHGDLKISNILFEGESSPERDRAVALIDFDTLMRAPLWSEWGDAWRSWCNRKGEDESEASFDLDVFEASLAGFVSGYGESISREERASLVLATERLALELAARYTTDLLEESYFAWDERRFASAGEHNRLRARGQISLYEAAREGQSKREALLASI